MNDAHCRKCGEPYDSCDGKTEHGECAIRSDLERRIRATAVCLFRAECAARQRATSGKWLSAPYLDHEALARDCLRAAEAFWLAEGAFTRDRMKQPAPEKGP